MALLLRFNRTQTPTEHWAMFTLINYEYLNNLNYDNVFGHFLSIDTDPWRLLLIAHCAVYFMDYFHLSFCFEFSSLRSLSNTSMIRFDSNTINIWWNIGKVYVEIFHKYLMIYLLCFIKVYQFQPFSFCNCRKQSFFSWKKNFATIWIGRVNEWYTGKGCNEVHMRLRINHPLYINSRFPFHSTCLMCPKCILLPSKMNVPRRYFHIYVYTVHVCPERRTCWLLEKECLLSIDFLGTYNTCLKWAVCKQGISTSS